MSRTFEEIIIRKESALQLLGGLGFVDNNDDEFPGTIFHRDTGMVIDTELTKAGDIVTAIFCAGVARGEESAQAAMRKALGL